MQAVVHRWHERGRQGCGQPEHRLRRLHHHLRRWVIARVLPYWPERQHDWHFVYVLGLDDKTYLARTYGGSIGKARVTGYCIKFRHLAAINVDVLQAAIQYGMSVQRAG